MQKIVNHQEDSVDLESDIPQLDIKLDLGTSADQEGSTQQMRQAVQATEQGNSNENDPLLASKETIREWQQIDNTLAHVHEVTAEDLTKQVSFYKKGGLLHHRWSPVGSQPNPIEQLVVQSPCTTNCS